MKTTAISLTEVRLSEEEQAAAIEVLKSGQLREGKRVRAFEEAFRSYVGVGDAVAVSSGTAALHLAYLALINPGDEVLVPAFTFIATASMVAIAGGIPVFCDIDPETWEIDPADIERKITPKTKAIAGVHLFGNSCDIDAIQKIASKRGLKIIWDAAQSMGTFYRGKDIAQYPDAVCFSFYPSKNMTTGEGGMVATDDLKAAAKVRLLKSHGQAEKYCHQILGFNYRMTEVEAVIGMIQLQKLKGFIQQRKKIGAQFAKGFAGAGDIAIQKTTPGCDPSFNYFSIALKKNAVTISRDELVQELRNEGVPCAVHYPIPLHEQPCFADYRRGAVPVSEALARNILSLPMHPYLTEPDVDFVVEKVLQLVGKYATK